MQHIPAVCQLLESIASNTISVRFRANMLILSILYVTCQDALFPATGEAVKAAPGLVVLFYVGGATYEEAKTVAQYNQARAGSMLTPLLSRSFH